jgi:hypothetical protein
MSMTDRLDDRLAALAAVDAAPALDGLEARVWAEVKARKTAAGLGSAGLRVTLTLAALALGLALGALHPSRPAHLSELGLLSEDGLLAPSVRLGGGA